MRLLLLRLGRRSLAGSGSCRGPGGGFAATGACWLHRPIFLPPRPPRAGTTRLQHKKVAAPHSSSATAQHARGKAAGEVVEGVPRREEGAQAQHEDGTRCDGETSSASSSAIGRARLVATRASTWFVVRRSVSPQLRIKICTRSYIRTLACRYIVLGSDSCYYGGVTVESHSVTLPPEL